MEFSWASFDLYEQLAERCSPTQPPTQKLKSLFSMLCSQEIDSSLVLLEMILESLQSGIFRFRFHSLGSKILKFMELIIPKLIENIRVLLGFVSYFSRFRSFDRFLTVQIFMTNYTFIAFSYQQSCKLSVTIRTQTVT